MRTSDERALRRSARALRTSLVVASTLCVACSGVPVATRVAPLPDADAFRDQVPPAGPVPTVTEPLASRLSLPNGFSLLSIPWQCGTVALELRCRTGSKDDPEGRAGATSLLARMLTEGTETTTALQQAIAFEDLGAALDYDAGVETFGLSTEVRPQDLERAVQLLADALLRPALRQEDFERVRSERLDDLKADRQDPEQLAWIIADRAVLGPVWGRPTAGSPEDVGALTVDDLRTHYERAVTPARCALLAAGAYEGNRLEHSVLAAFGDLAPTTPDSPEPASVPATAKPTGNVLFLERDDAVQSAIVAGHRVPGRLDAEYEAREVVDRAFGGLFTSRLNSNLRERHGFTYGAFSSLVAHRDLGGWFLSSSVRADSTAQAVVEMGHEIERLSTDPLGPDEVTRATADLVQRRRARLEHDTLLLANLREPFAFDLSLAHEAGYASRLTALTPPALASAARSLAVTPFVTVVVAAPAQAAALREGGFEVVAADPNWLE